MANWLPPVSWVSQRFEFGLKFRSDHGLQDLSRNQLHRFLALVNYVCIVPFIRFVSDHAFLH